VGFDTDSPRVAAIGVGLPQPNQAPGAPFGGLLPCIARWARPRV